MRVPGSQKRGGQQQEDAQRNAGNRTALCNKLAKSTPHCVSQGAGSDFHKMRKPQNGKERGKHRNETVRGSKTEVGLILDCSKTEVGSRIPSGVSLAQLSGSICLAERGERGENNRLQVIEMDFSVGTGSRRGATSGTGFLSGWALQAPRTACRCQRSASRRPHLWHSRQASLVRQVCLGLLWCRQPWRRCNAC